MNTNELIARIMMPSFNRTVEGNIIKYQNHSFEILQQVGSTRVIVVVDKRTTPHKYHTNIESAYKSIQVSKQTRQPNHKPQTIK